MFHLHCPEKWHASSPYDTLPPPVRSKLRFCNEALKEGGENVMKTSLDEVTCLDATPIFGVHIWGAFF